MSEEINCAKKATYKTKTPETENSIIPLCSKKLRKFKTTQNRRKILGLLMNVKSLSANIVALLTRGGASPILSISK